MSDSSSQAANSRLGLYLFFVYSLFYLGFVVVIAFSPELSQWMLLPGLNLAVLWGFALIGVAFVLSLIYGLGCKPEDVTSQSESTEESI